MSRMPRARRVRPLALVAALATVPLLLVACAAPAELKPAALPDGLEVRLQQGRLDVEARRLVVRVENTGGEAVTIDGFELEAPTLATALVREEAFELPPGDALAIRLPLPPAECGAEAGAAVLHVDATTPDGPAAGELTPDDPFDTLARVADADCLAESVDTVATIAVPEHLRAIGSGVDRRAVIDVLVTPAASGSGSFVIDRVYGTTLLNAEGGVDWPVGVEISAGDAPQTISLDVRPARCDAHAIADDKRGTILPFEIRTSDGRAGRLDRSSGATLKAELYQYYGERCGLALPAG
ncbi:hypothetical protein EV187_1478 [Agromyces ramosus]|uniref:Lipoprotein n=2 Tax=Agromyces ramosus TaxID=33879 RepID=A0A4Q7MCI3_9MICO|nr:hypothetical protein EV187_1478 [Agromyces ramosus]